MSTAELEKRSTIKDQVKRYEQEFAQALPSMIKPERFVRVALTQFTKNPKLLDCTPQSVIASLLNAAGMGLEVDGRVGHLIPFGDICTFLPDYKGLVELAMRSGLVSMIHADVICENDEYEENKGQVITHKIDRRKERGAPYAVYTFVKMKDGAESYQIMSKHDVERIRDTFSIGYRAAIKYNKTDSPWMTSPDSMWMKTCFRQHSKWLPLSAEFRDAADHDPDMTPVPIDITKDVELLPLTKVIPTTPDAASGKKATKKTPPPPDADGQDGEGEEGLEEADEPTARDTNQDRDTETSDEVNDADDPTPLPPPVKKSRLGRPPVNSITAPAPKRTLNNPDGE